MYVYLCLFFILGISLWRSVELEGDTMAEPGHNGGII